MKINKRQTIKGEKEMFRAEINAEQFDNILEELPIWITDRVNEFAKLGCIKFNGWVSDWHIVVIEGFKE